jgi:uncharacterized protein YqhQ
MAKFYYGGQAVMEGVMMRGRSSAAVAIRRPDNSIYLYEEALNPRLYSNRLFRLPFLRGILLLWEMLVLGTRLMTLSANVATGALDPDAPTNSNAGQSDGSGGQSLSDIGRADGSGGQADFSGGRPQGSPIQAGVPATSLADGAMTGVESSIDILPEKPAAPPQIGGLTLALTLLVSLGFAIAVFFLGPLFITGLLHNQIGQGWFSLVVEGLIRLGLLLGYLYLIGRLPDIQRLFGYHGAEHKAINAMEQGDALDIPHVRQASRVHTRCGTGFLLLVVVVSIVVFAFVGSPSSFLIKVASRIVLVPVVAGIAYELMRLGAANYRFRIVRWLLAPGLALQGLTTREPDDSMIECAIASLQRVMRRDAQSAKEQQEVDTTLPPLVVSR